MGSEATRTRTLVAALILHALLAVWLLVNGVAHTAAVIGKANAGTLSRGAHAGSLVAVGIGLIAAGAWVAISCRTLWRARRADEVGLRLPWSSLAAVALVLLAIGIGYGAAIVRGSLVFASLAAAMLAVASLVSRRTRQRAVPQT